MGELDDYAIKHSTKIGEIKVYKEYPKPVKEYVPVVNNEELLAKYKALFPDNVEAIVVRKDDYDRLYGDLTIENIELKLEIERLNNRLKTSNDTCNYLRNTIDKAIEYMDRRDLEWGSDEHNKMMNILKGSDKE